MEERKYLKQLLSEADNIIYITKKTRHSLLNEQNRYIIEQSSYCICALQSKKRETIQLINLQKRED